MAGTGAAVDTFRMETSACVGYCRTEELEPLGNADAAAPVDLAPGLTETMNLYQCPRCLSIWRLSVVRGGGRERREMTRLQSGFGRISAPEEPANHPSAHRQ